jgi:hypothetical protein
MNPGFAASIRLATTAQLEDVQSGDALLKLQSREVAQNATEIRPLFDQPRDIRQIHVKRLS